MTDLIIQCNDLLKGRGFAYAFCGGHALDIYLGRTTRPHGDIDISAWWEDRDAIIAFMWSQGWSAYEGSGNGTVHLIDDLSEQMYIHPNLFFVRDGCSFFHIEHKENQIFKCEIDHVEQKNLDFIEFLFNQCSSTEFIYRRNHAIRRSLDKAVLHRDNIPYLSPALVLLYKSTDLTRKENRLDFDMALPSLCRESKEWLENALTTAFPDGHDWIARLKRGDV